MIVIRFSKALMVWSMAFFASLVAFNNLTDYDSNFAFIYHVFLMDTTFPGNKLMYRAIENPLFHHFGYLIIILLEILTAICCWVGGFKLIKSLKADNKTFQLAKKWSVIGLTLGFLTWNIAFMSIGGEWFAMWMSSEWNGVPDAFRFFITLLMILIYLTLPNDS